MATYKDFLFEVKDRIGIVTINKPDRMNALNYAMSAELKRIIADAVNHPDVRVIVITGAGRAFCAGADMSLLEDQAGGGTGGSDEVHKSTPAASLTADFVPDASEHFKESYGYFIHARKPIIAAINGSVAGVGLALTLYCDLRFIASEAKISTAFSQRGLIAEHGLSWMLPKLIGHAKALDLLLSARKFGAAEAEQLGVVNKVFPQETFMADVMAYARHLADTVSPRSMAIIKAQVWKSLFQNFNDAMAMADSEMAISLTKEDFKEGVAHYLEKRLPNFKGV
jgi:enoyl-CoA hydratase/carnithine racemase